MASAVTFIGFGEAGLAFAAAGARGYDRKLDDPSLRAAKLSDFDAGYVTACDSAKAALDGARMVLSLVTADQALPAARSAAPLLAAGALWLDMNSVAPGTKQGAAAAIGPVGRYVDVAVMAPVHPLGLAVPLLVSGPHAEAGAEALATAGFTHVRIVGSRVGDASAIKMIRSVLVKGMEALSAECALAAEAAGVRAEVIASLEASWAGADWERRFDYNLERMMVHGERRAAEMREVVRTLDDLGTGSAMSRATACRQQDIGERHLVASEGLAAKLAALLPAAPLESAA
ncbi:NAD(P)-dependent oxidoreductase [Sphingomonas ginkgonis]|uniref:NAD(P)-dependent oxidoreductase n=1 Tax=Sphingomonas ginkgonis TaxID=2315330 RepID=A0A429V9Q8_9SPHN|nr:NAD(P)-dependent oxidoreductase [Sphingomonas ginkgonis]RST30674.1 NAD(P)-dependent oxidoreductase [Sphingomonas ginkgonis]